MLDTAGFITHLKQQTFYDGQICHSHDVPAARRPFRRAGNPARPPPAGCPRAAQAGPLYSHQAQAINRIRRGENVMVSTSSASGKSMCYNVPVMQAALENPRSCAIYLFPTKALAQDQFGKIKHLFSPAILRREEFDTFDGDTPGSERAAIRRKARLVITNPDMLHVNMLPNHASWARVWSNLRFVVVDEAHAYRGVFGSNVALVLRRLRRLCTRLWLESAIYPRFGHHR